MTAAATLAGGLPATATAAEAAPRSAAGTSVDVIVRELPESGGGPERAVTTAGGVVGDHIGIIDGFTAQVPATALGALRATPGVHSVTANGRVQLQTATYDSDKDPTAMQWVAGEITGAGEYWNNGLTGKGVGVAVIDSGVVPVNGLRTPGKVVHGPDLSFESEVAGLRHLDTYGHGTHVAGIIAGRDDAAPKTVSKGDTKNFLGMAPDARLISLKVADSAGATDVSQVIAAIDWVVQHRNDAGLNIRVLNLSFGTDGVQDYRLDPLAYAVEVAWRKGIAVVVSAGNEGFGSAKLNNPAYDPFVIAVGGADGNGTYDVADDTIRDWSSSGDGSRNPDLVAPGASIASLRDPGSGVDTEYPQARIADRFFRGTGTSQAAAVVSGAAALVIQQRPTITPDQLKALLRQTAQRLPKASPAGQGAGMLDLKRARDTATPSKTKSAQKWTPSSGTGSLDLSRGTTRVVKGTGELRGEQDAFGRAWDGKSWSLASLNGATWAGGAYGSAGFDGGTWQRASWRSSVWLSSGQLTRASWRSTGWTGGAWPSDAAYSDLQRASWRGRLWSSDGWR
jgi:serine protease AprX